ncbi:MAG: DUF4367 domain-containing protein [Eubacteriales bacterium]|nr:DUF4367 domain-containing protein [Eubacteriales bacterium]
MKNRYGQIMDRVEVTPEMRDRILSNIQDQAGRETSHSKTVPFANRRKYGSIAAAVVLAVVGAFAVENFTKISQTTEPPEKVELTVTAPVETASLEELAKNVGFDVEGIHKLPFEASQVTYMAYSDGAEITYRNDSQQVIYSKNTEIGGNNGHYETYSVEKTVNVDGIKVTLKGNDTGYQIASWDDGTYGYMIYSDTPLDEQQLTAMIGK